MVLVGIYVVVSIAAQAFAGPEFLINNADDVLSALGGQVLGSPWDKILIIAVLTSASASTQTTILPTTRTALSMAFHGALPRSLARIHPQHQTPSTATLWMGAVSIAWYVGLTILSEDVLFDSIASLGLMIAFYYGLTGYACAFYYRHELLRSARNMIMIGIVPVVGGLMLTYVFAKSCIDLADPANSESGNSWFGIGPPLIIGAFFLVLGLVLMIAWRLSAPAFFPPPAGNRRPRRADHTAQLSLGGG